MRAIYCGDYTALATTKWGAKIYVDTRDVSIAPHIMTEGDWEPWVTNCMVTYLQKHKGCTFIDVGANVGWYTLLAARLGAGYIYAFEPNPRMVELLRKTLSVNGLRQQVTLTEAACGAEPGISHLQIDWTNVGDAHLVDPGLPSGYAHGDQARCDVVRLDDVVKARHLSKDGKLTPVIMKIDVEGFEPHVLAGATELLSFSQPVLFIEHHQDAAHEQLLQKLQYEDYELRHVQHTGHPSAPLEVSAAMALDGAETILCLPKDI